VAVKNADCAKRMIAWCTLALLLVTVFLMAGYALFEGAGRPPTVQPERRPQALPTR
jgi:hypothetical protein